MSSISRRKFVEKTALTSAAIASSTAGNLISNAAEKPPFEDVQEPFLTDAEDFYTVARGNPKPHTLTGEALANAGMTPETWKLKIEADPFKNPPDIRVGAEVEKSVTLDYATLLKLGEKHSVKYIKAMQCLNIAEPLGQGLWEGVPLRYVLQECGKIRNVRRIYYNGFHNNDPKQIFQSSVSYTQAMETPPGELPAFLAYKLNGEPLTPLRGGPVRMIIPWAHGFKSIKWIQEMFLTNDYRTNDTYALKNNDPESYLKTAAYVLDGPEKVDAGDSVSISGQVISGLSGFERLEILLRKVDNAEDPRLNDDELASRKPEWKPCEILPPPDWGAILPDDVSPKELLGFDPKAGKPLSWPTRYGMVSWVKTISDLAPGIYELYARAVDKNGFAQPEPRPVLKSGKNAIQFHRFEVA